MKSVSISFLFVLSTSMAISQSVASDNGVLFLYPNDSEASKNSNRKGSYSGIHPLGEVVTEKMNKFESEYVYYMKSTGAYPVEEKIILKKAIYLAVKKIEKYYLSAMERGDLSLEKVEKAFLNILDNSIKLTKYRTENVEVDLKKIKKPEDLIVYFNKIRFKDTSKSDDVQN